MNALDRNVSGSSRNTLSLMMVSRCRASIPMRVGQGAEHHRDQHRHGQQHDQPEDAAGVVGARAPGRAPR